MTRAAPKSRRAPARPSLTSEDAEVIRRFFALIEGIEPRRRPADPAPETKARISRLDVPPTAPRKG